MPVRVFCSAVIQEKKQEEENGDEVLPAKRRMEEQGAGPCTINAISRIILSLTLKKKKK